MAKLYERNIFAVELSQVLDERGLDLGALRRKPLSFDGKIVERLLSSLKRLKPLCALNQIEMMDLVNQLKLDKDEYLRIYAAYVALGVQRFMLDYISAERAWEVADEVRKEVLAAQRRDSTLSMDFLTRHARELAAQDAGTNSDDIALGPLEDALDSYDEAVILSTLGLFENNAEQGRLLLAQAQIYIQKATQTLENVSPSVRALDDWTFWLTQAQKLHETIEEALE